MLAKLDKTLRQIPKGTFANVGGALGAKYGPIAGGLGRMAGAGLSAITGYGDYRVSGNSLTTVSASVDMVPQFVKNEHSIRVKHREFIKDLLVPDDPASFNIKDYVINPGNRELFPWLGQMARQYSQYKIHGMVFAYKSMSSDYAASGPLGTVFMATNYNALDRPFSSKLELENTEFAVSTKPSMSLVHAIECDPKVSGFEILYIRDPGYDTGETSDRRFYDYGRFQVGTQGLPGTPGNTLGELWVTYDIELIKPIIGGTFVSDGISLVSRADGSTGVGGGNKIPYLTMAMPAINPAATTAYDVVPTNAATLTDDVDLWGSVFNTNSSGTMKFLKNGFYRVIIGSTATTTGSNYLLSPPANTALTVTPTNAGRAWHNAAAKDVTPFSTQSYGGFLVPHAVTTSALSNVALYNFILEVWVYGIQNAEEDFVTIDIANFTTHNTTLVSSWTRTLVVSWAAFAQNEQTAQYLPVSPGNYIG